MKTIGQLLLGMALLSILFGGHEFGRPGGVIDASFQVPEAKVPNPHHALNQLCLGSAKTDSTAQSLFLNGGPNTGLLPWLVGRSRADHEAEFFEEGEVDFQSVFAPGFLNLNEMSLETYFELFVYPGFSPDATRIDYCGDFGSAQVSQNIKSIERLNIWKKPAIQFGTP